MGVLDQSKGVLASHMCFLSVSSFPLREKQRDTWSMYGSQDFCIDNVNWEAQSFGLTDLSALEDSFWALAIIEMEIVLIICLIL